ncbi:hypothetical protein K1719_015998 [Acacia pycnantha]|nr:hypothetical protein K1719_015998 [Acacia pycnantha]
MNNLRVLIFFDGLARDETLIDFPFDLHPFSNKLRSLKWNFYPLETLPSGSYLGSLVELYLNDSNVKRLWDGKQDLGNLKTIDLGWSEQLIELPDLLMAYKLESVNLEELESSESKTHLESVFHYGYWGDWRAKLYFSSNNLSLLWLEEIVAKIPPYRIIGFRKLKHIKICGDRVGSVSIDELCCSTNLEVFEVTNLKQVIDIKQLHSLFDAWRNLRKLRLEGYNFSEIPNNIKALTKLKCLSLDDSSVETLPAYVNHFSSLKHISLRRCKRLKSILGLPPFLRELDASECTLLETVSSDSLVWNQCSFNFRNCEKLDEHSLAYIQELTLSPMTLADDYYAITCYPGSRVPEWMEYKPMTEAFNATQLTCYLGRSQYLLICCVAPPHLVSKRLSQVHCYFSHHDGKKFPDYDDKEFHCSPGLGYVAFNQDHVLLWPVRRLSSGIGNDAKISCEIFLEYLEGEHLYNVPAKACGAYLISEWDPNRVADIMVEDQLSPTKQLKTSDVSHGDDFICHPLQLKFLLKQTQLSL